MSEYLNIIKQLELVQHPEGGYYRRVYESAQQFPFDGVKPQAISTAIMYLLHGAAYSALHKIESDELWFLGAHNTSLCIIELRDGLWVETVLSAENPTHCVKAHTWFGARLSNQAEEAFALAYCTVAPGFEFERFQLADAATLSALYPEHKEKLEAICRSAQV